mmetsp:Transcript_124334/g.284914  ORF Transcript_124334/g.284914 Transcript_124334/m.284914 type:complete len:233 (-) Transcript_124334:499-1197(-)
MLLANTATSLPRCTRPCCGMGTCRIRGQRRSRCSPRTCSAMPVSPPWKIRFHAGCWSLRHMTKQICWARRKSPSSNCGRRLRRRRLCRYPWIRSRLRGKGRPPRTSAEQVLRGKITSWRGPRRRELKRTCCPRKSSRTRLCCSSSGCSEGGPCRTRCSKERRSVWTSSTSFVRPSGGRRRLVPRRRSSALCPGSRSEPWKACWSPCRDRCWHPCWTSSARSCSASRSSVALL